VEEVMKNLGICFLLQFLLMHTFLYSESQGKEETSKGKIILPDVPIVIEDESKAEGYTNKEPKTIMEKKSIETEDLSKVQLSKKFKEEVGGRRKEDFSISMVEFSYGMYENFIFDVHLGKKIGDFNYLVSYLRNTRSSVGLDTNTFFNTERAVDDLFVDASYGFSKNLMATLEAGYYNRTLGLFTNENCFSETRFYTPARLSLEYFGEEIGNFTGNLNFGYLALRHKFKSSYESTNIYEVTTDFKYEKLWGKDNFLMANLGYNFCFVEQAEHSFEIGVRDRFPFVSFLALQFGLNFYIYSYKQFFWFPELYLFFKLNEQFDAKTGLGGNVDYKKIPLILKENQLNYTSFLPQESWNYMAGIYYRPVESVRIGCEGMFDYYYTYRNFGFDTQTGLYYVENTTNISMISINPFIKFVMFEDFSLALDGKIRIFDNQKIILLPFYEAGLKAGYFFRQIGLNAETKLSYIGERKLLENVSENPYWKWDIFVSQKVGEFFILELRLNNILNQRILEKIYLPEGGFSFDLGLKFNF